jgi:galactosyl transferase GMA12/MNN10 family
MPRVCILSGCDHIRFPSYINHRIFAETRGAAYRWLLFETRAGDSPYFHKLRMVRDTLRDFEWVFWLDDDAYFTDFEWDIAAYVAREHSDLVICCGAMNGGVWTYINSGAFFLRRSARSVAFLDAAISTDISTAREWWDPNICGKFTSGDQDLLTYLLLADARFTGDFCSRLTFPEFNSREYHYRERPQERRVLHLVPPKRNRRGKRATLERFAKRMGLPLYLVPPAIAARFDLSTLPEVALARRLEQELDGVATPPPYGWAFVNGCTSPTPSA